MPSWLTIYWEQFWDIRGICGAEDNPITPDILKQWEQHDYRKFERWERECFFAMDRALRHAGAEVLKYHAGRKKIDLSDRDKKTVK